MPSRLGKGNFILPMEFMLFGFCRISTFVVPAATAFQSIVEIGDDLRVGPEVGKDLVAVAVHE